MSKDKNQPVPAGGGVDGERDPLTLGKTTYGEDIKGSSTVGADPVSDEPETPAEEEAETPAEEAAEVPAEAPVEAAE